MKDKVEIPVVDNTEALVKATAKLMAEIEEDLKVADPDEKTAAGIIAAKILPPGVYIVDERRPIRAGHLD